MGLSQQRQPGLHHGGLLSGADLGEEEGHKVKAKVLAASSGDEAQHTQAKQGLDGIDAQGETCTLAVVGLGFRLEGGVTLSLEKEERVDCDVPGRLFSAFSM